MQILGLEPHPAIPGAQLARFEDGSSMALPPGLSLQDSGATAQAAPMTPDDFAAKWNPPQPAQQAQDFRAAPIGLAPPQSPPPQPVQGRDVPQQQAQQYVPTNRDRLLQQLDSPVTYSPGTAAFDPTKEAGRRKAVPVSQSVAVQGAHEFDPNAVRNYQQMELEAARTNAQASVLEAENNANLQLGIHSEEQRLFAQRQAEQRAAEVDYNTRLGSIEKDAADLANHRINPDRIFENMSVWKKITLALASGLGGLANPNGENQVWKMIQSQVDQDVHSQEVALHTKQRGHENALSRLSQQWGSVQAGKAALRVQELEAVKQSFVAQAAMAGSEAANKRAEGGLQAFAAMQAKDLEQMRVASLGQVTQQTQSAMMAPRAATAGGFRQKPLEMQARQQGLAQGLREKEVETQGKELANLEKRKELSGEAVGKSAEKVNDQVAQYGQRRSALEASKTALDRFIAENGITRDSNGNLVPPDDIAGMGVIGSRIPRMFTGQQGVNNRAALKQIVMSKVQEAFGAANENQVEMIADSVIGDGSPKHIAAELNQIEHGFAATTRNIESSYPRQVRAQYKINRADATREDLAKKSAWQPVKFGDK